MSHRLLASSVAAALIAIAVLVIALWGWEAAPDLASSWQSSHFDTTVWAIRSAAITAAALAQLIVLHFVAGAFYARRPIDDVLRTGLGIFCALSTVCAIALALASR